MQVPLPRSALVVAIVVAAGVLVATAHALVPSDPDASHPAYAALNLPAAWDVTTGSPNVVVAVVDTGVDASHPDLADAVLPGYDFVDDDRDASDPPGAGHGTAVAGAAVARANNGIGGVGACFRCSVLPLRVVGRDGIALNTVTAEAIDYAVDHGAAVVNVSLYGPNLSEPLEDAVARARAAGVLVVAAAGNEGNEREQFPAAFRETISVGSATSAGELASFSSRGSWVKFAAPECAPITVLGGGSGIGCMTSVSSPLVAGIAALLRSQAALASADEIESALARTGRAVPGTLFGVVDAAAALRTLGNPKPRLRPVVLGVPAVGGMLEAFTGIWSGAGLPVTYQWERCRGDCAPIAGATSSMYAPTALDAGRRIRVVVSAGEIGIVASFQTNAIAVGPRLLAPPSISGRPRIGRQLVADRGRWEGTSLRFAITWQRCRRECRQIATGSGYRPRPRDRGSRLTIEVVAYNSLGVVTALSKRTGVVR